MSKIIFERAQKYVDKILYLYSVMDKVQGLSDDGCSIYGKSKFKRHVVLYRYNKADSYHMFMRRRYDNHWQKSSNNYYIESTGLNSMPNSDKRLIKISEFSEDLDFQLSILYDNAELLNYYIQCLLYSKGFRGSIRIGISHPTLNALIRHVDVMYKDRDKLWRNIPMDSTLFSF